ncbi:hypothetical protein ACUZ9N_01625 [Mycoplasmopsis gallinarum]
MKLFKKLIILGSVVVTGLSSVIAVSCVNKETDDKPINPLVWGFKGYTVTVPIPFKMLDSRNIEFRNKLAPHLYKIIDDFIYRLDGVEHATTTARFLTNEEMTIKDEDTEFEKGLKTIYQNNKKFFENLSLNTHKYTEANIRVKTWDRNNDENWFKNDYFYIDETTLTNEQRLYHNLYTVLFNDVVNMPGYDEDSWWKLGIYIKLKKRIISVINDYYKVNLPQGFETRIYDVKFSYNENRELIFDFVQVITYQGKQVPKYLTQYININFNSHLNLENINFNKLNRDRSNKYDDYEFDYSLTEYKNRPDYGKANGYQEKTYFLDEENEPKINAYEETFSYDDYKYTIDYFDEKLDI